tara:strand:+ start:829 stop:1077 length:249 start_codon:yes stop_codon:yes gene_type:complete
MVKVIKFPMDRINMTDWQKITLQEKFGKKKHEKKRSKVFIILILLATILVFFSLFFPNTETQVLNSSSFFPGFLNIGDLSHG